MQEKSYFSLIEENNSINLYLDEVLFEYEEPVLFTCTDENHRLYLCLCYDVRGTQKWIVVHTDENALTRMLIGEKSIRDTFCEASGNKYEIEAQIAAEDVFHQIIIDEACNKLPDTDLYFEDKRGIREKYLMRLFQRVLMRLKDANEESAGTLADVFPAISNIDNTRTPARTPGPESERIITECTLEYELTTKLPKTADGKINKNAAFAA